MSKEIMETKENTSVSNLSPNPEPQELIESAAKAAKSLMSVAKPINIAGKKYLTVEDWQTIGTIYGVAAGTTSSVFIEEAGLNGYEAHAVVRRTSDGVIVSEASGRCLKEGVWKNRENFALASMAQTRAVSKALRNLLAWVVRLEGFETTPAEEITEEMKSEIKNTGTMDSFGLDPENWYAQRNTTAFVKGADAGKKWSELDIGKLNWVVDNYPAKKEFAEQELLFREEENKKPLTTTLADLEVKKIVDKKKKPIPKKQEEEEPPPIEDEDLPF